MAQGATRKNRPAVIRVCGANGGLAPLWDFLSRYLRETSPLRTTSRGQRRSPPNFRAQGGPERLVPAWSTRFCRLPCHHQIDEKVLRYKGVATKSPSVKGRQAMAHNFAINDDVHHQLQGPQGRAGVKQRSVYTIVTCLPIEADGRPRYRIKSKTENVERVVTEEQISRLG